MLLKTEATRGSYNRLSKILFGQTLFRYFGFGKADLRKVGDGGGKEVCGFWFVQQKVLQKFVQKNFRIVNTVMGMIVAIIKVRMFYQSMLAFEACEFAGGEM